MLQAEGGECKNDTNKCDGNYMSGVCGGPSGRRCCVKGVVDKILEAVGKFRGHFRTQ